MNHPPEPQFEQFDGEMIITADRELSPETPLLVTIIDTKSGEKASAGPLVLEMLSLLEEVASLEDPEAHPNPSSSTKEQIERKLLEARFCSIQLLEAGMLNKKLLETLIEGRIKVGLWLDSIGGEVEQENKVNWALDYLDKHHASVHSYVGIKAASAAFDLAFLGNEINALSRSVFIWHFSDSSENPRLQKVRQLHGQAALDDATSEEFNDLLSIFDRVSPEKKEQLIAEVLRQINHPHNHEGNVFLEGDYLHEMGLTNRSFRKMSQLIDQFQADFPLHAGINSTYFTTTVAQKVYDQISHLPSWHDTKPLHLTEKVQRQLEIQKPPRSSQA